MTSTTPPNSAAEVLSPTQRRTRRQAQLLAAGRHPLGLHAPLPLHPDAAPWDDRDADGRRCGNCAFRLLIGHHSRSYPKCAWPGGEDGPWPRASHSEATDTRAWWPACKDHQWKEPPIMTQIHPRDILNLPLPENDAGAGTVRDYLIALLTEVWRQEEGFSGKRPFGNDGWQHDVYRALEHSGLIAEDDTALAEELIIDAIAMLGEPPDQHERQANLGTAVIP